jgi:hypothetical protein
MRGHVVARGNWTSVYGMFNVSKSYPVASNVSICTYVLRDTTDMFSIEHLNASGRSLKDRIAVLDTRGSGQLASRIKWLAMENFPGNNGDGTLNLHGFDVRADKDTGILRMVLINHRPPFDPVTGDPLDASKVGANSTIEVFQTTAGGDSMRHIRTHANEVISTPNRVQWASDDAFVFTNDHNTKLGFVSLRPETTTNSNKFRAGG